MTNDEINEKVARRLGAKRLVAEGHDCGDHYHDHWELTHEWNYRKYAKFLPNYCEDLKAAWEIAEKNAVINSWWCFTIHAYLGGWVAGWSDRDGSWRNKTDSDTAPMAICLAFLKM